MRKHPNLFEANALIFLRRLSAKYGRPLTLLTIPDNEWKELAEQGFDLLWLMGVWKRSPGARECALHTPELRHAYDLALPGWKEEDVVGSPYAVYSYSLEPRLGGENDLAELKVKLNSFGLGLILDYVPNHLALDHPWTKSKPDCFIEGSREDFQGHPGLFFKTHEGKYFAHGKDPYFSAWKDTVQINFFSGTARQAAVETLLNIAGKSAGVRCDMAMLGLNRVFENTWGDFLEEISMPRSEFWSEVIEEVKSEYPDFILLPRPTGIWNGSFSRLGLILRMTKNFTTGFFIPRRKISAAI